MGHVRKEYRGVDGEYEQVQHPDRVSWYTALIGEWTTQVPQVAVIDAQTVAVWIGPYSSVFGVRHRAATQVWARSVEEGLECLCTWVYEDVQADLRSVYPMAIAGEVHVKEWEPWVVS
jgi:hypothetical protein